MKLFQLQYFVTVCRCKNNISRAANELHISQPSVSNAIRELEDEFGVSLFQRINHKLFITGEGEALLSYAEDLLCRSDELVTRMQDLGNRKNHIKIGIPPMIGSFLFPTIFQQFSQLYPLIQLEAFEDGSLQLLRLMEEDLLDVSIITLNHSDLDHFYSVKIIDTEVVFCTWQNHPFSTHGSLSLTELSCEPLVLLKEGSYLCQLIESSFRSCGITPEVVLHTNQLTTIASFLRKRIASAFLFREVAATMPDTVMIPLDQPATVHIGLVWKRDHYLYSDTARFIRFVKEKSYLPSL